MNSRALGTLREQLARLRDELAREGWDRARGRRLLHRLQLAQALLADGALRDDCTALAARVATTPDQQPLGAAGLRTLLDLGQLTRALGAQDPVRRLPARPLPLPVQVLAVGAFDQDLEPLRLLLAATHSTLDECARPQDMPAPGAADQIVLADMAWLLGLADAARVALAARAAEAAGWIVLSEPGVAFARQVELLRCGVGHFVEKPVAPHRLAALIDGLCGDEGEYRFRVVLVGDEHSEFAAHAAVLAAAGMELLFCDEPLLALDFIAEYQPDALLVAIEMTACRGQELVTLIRQRETCARMPVVYLTDWNEHERQLAARRSAAEDFLSKAGDPAVLLATVTTLARRHRRLQRAAAEVAARDENLSRALAVARVGSWVLDADSLCMRWSPEACRILGLAPEHNPSLDDYIASIVHADDRDALRQFRRATLKGEPAAIEYRVQRGAEAGAEVRWVHSRAERIVDAAGNVLRYVGTLQDITERRRAELDRNNAKRVLAQIVDGTPIPTFVIDAEHRVTQWNRACELVSGIAAVEVVGTRNPWKAFYAQPRPVLADLIVNDDRAALDAMEHYYTGTFRPSAVVRGAYEAEGYFANTGRWLSFLAAPLRDDEGRIVGAIETLQDITARKEAEENLRVAAIAFESQEGMMITDANGVMVRVNQAFTRLTGYSTEEAIGRTPALFKSGRHDAAYYQRMWTALKNNGHWQGEIWNRRKNGKVYAEMLTISSVVAPDGQVSNYIGTFSDISRNSEAEAEIHRLAFYDPLTQLPNRRLLLDRLQQAIGASARSRREGALFFIDLDNFKTLNDTLGHDMGDLLLRQVAQRLCASVRECDTVARLGGDEFVVMLEGLDPSPDGAAPQAKAVGEKILAALNQPYLLAEHTHHSTPSIGVTLFGANRETIDELLKRADFAMYQAKAAGRNTLRFFDPDMQAVVTARAGLEAELRHGLHAGEFLLHYQPQVDAGGRTTGAEALVRWRHPRRGMVSPAEFIPLAEDSGLILPLGHWVLETACLQLVSWARQPTTARYSVAVNVSARQFHHQDFVDQVLAVLDQTGADPGLLKLELTESLLLDDVEDVVRKMGALKARGVGFSLDDFGTGYSSLTYLKRLPLDQLKIDQSFVRDILTDPNDAAIAIAIITLGQSLGLAVIAEGVETEGQRDFLARHGCDAYQGYLFGRPLPVADFEQRMATQD